MFKFLEKIVLFLLCGYLIGEIVTRMYKLNIDIPDYYQDSDGLIKNVPNQTGHYRGGNKWIINKYGNYGFEPKSLDNLITVVGDSYIENVMNPIECHQANFLSNKVANYNFYPCARGGASFIEMMEMTKAMEHLHPLKQLLYVHHGDFTESITEITNIPVTVQWSVATDKIRHAKLSRSRIKDVLYNFKFAYFLYRNYILDSSTFATNNRGKNQKDIDYEKIQLLLNFVKKNYKFNTLVLIFSPDSDIKLVEMLKKNHFQTFELKATDYKSWQLENDSHWSCKGHEAAANQVAKLLTETK